MMIDVSVLGMLLVRDDKEAAAGGCQTAGGHSRRTFRADPYTTVQYALKIIAAYCYWYGWIREFLVKAPVYQIKYEPLVLHILFHDCR